jgi:cell division protein FtsB
MQSAAPLSPTQMPPRPTCSPSAFSGADCQDRWHIYNQTAHQVTAPLQQQIEDLNKLTTDQQAQIKKLSDQIEADSVVALQAKLDYAAAVQAKAVAHTDGLQQGAGIGVGATLILWGLIFRIRRLTRNVKIREKPQATGYVDITTGQN